MKMGRNRVLEQLNQKVARKQQSHRTKHSFGSRFSCLPFSPEAYGLWNNLYKNRRKHKSCTERNQIFKKTLVQTLRTRRSEHKSANKIGKRRQRPKNEES